MTGSVLDAAFRASFSHRGVVFAGGQEVHDEFDARFNLRGLAR